MGKESRDFVSAGLRCRAVARVSKVSGAGGTEQFVTKLAMEAAIFFFRPLKRAGDVLTFRKPQCRDWGYPMPPAYVG